MIAGVRHVTYQQQSTTFGRTAGVFGLTSDGRGFVTGGGGSVDTVHKGVVNVILEAEDGRHCTHELPSSIAALEGGVLRLDLIDDRPFAVTNLSGRQPPTPLLGPADFIGRSSFTRRHALLLLAALIAAGQLPSGHPVAAAALALLFGAAPVLRLRRMHLEADNRRRLGRYMAEVMS